VNANIDAELADDRLNKVLRSQAQTHFLELVSDPGSNHLGCDAEGHFTPGLAQRIPALPRDRPSVPFVERNAGSYSQAQALATRGAGTDA